MANMTQIRMGLARYIDEEFTGKLEGLKKLLFATVAAAAVDNVGGALERLRQQELAHTLGLVTADGMPDIDVLYKKLREELEKAPCTFEIPMVGRVTLYATDADKLYAAIQGS